MDTKTRPQKRYDLYKLNFLITRDTPVVRDDNLCIVWNQFPVCGLKKNNNSNNALFISSSTAEFNIK